MCKNFILIFSVLLFAVGVKAQDSRPQASVLRTQSPIELDGKLDEMVWQRAIPATDFWQYFPTDSVKATSQTELSFAFDDEFVYVAVKCYVIGDDYMTTSLKRDYRASENDNITLIFDPFRDQTNAFIFGITPFGVQREALISGGGQRFEDFLSSWDNKWYSGVKTYDGYWIAELAIPFKTLRYREGEDRWFFNSYRFDMQGNERSTWARIPQNQIIMNRAYNGELIWEEKLKKPGANVSIIPYLSGGITQEQKIAEGDGKAYVNYQIGGDAKIGLGPSLNLDLTFNPDFSNVEADRQVTNLDRFEIFFPERRQFFLENSDLFANMGTGRIRPFFSRRIGIAQDTATGQNQQNPIYYGARLSGKINNNWRMGLLNMQTAPVNEINQPAVNYTVATLQRQVFQRSFLSFFFVNRQDMTDSTGKFAFQADKYNRVLGTDFTLASADNAWNGRYFFHYSLDESQESQAFTYGTNLSLTKRKFQIEWDQQAVGKGYEAEAGFVPRTGFFRIAPQARLYFYPKKGPVNIHGPGISSEVIWDDTYRKTDHQFGFTYEGQLNNTGRIELEVNQNYTYLFDEFDPSRSDLEPLPAGTDYQYLNAELSYRGDRRRKIYANYEINAGEYFNGQRYGIAGTLTARMQPFGFLSLRAGYNRISLPATPTQADTTINLLLIGPRLDITFTRKIFFTLFTQYNSQFDNLNFNARLQWRYKPVSDLFLVYIDNYQLNESQWQPYNRALILKLTYWLNL